MHYQCLYPGLTNQLHDAHSRLASRSMSRLESPARSVASIFPETFLFVRLTAWLVAEN